VIAADTTVEVDGEILAKPEDADDARRMLELLSGRAHLVHTGVAIARDAQLVHGVSTTLVRFVVLSGADIDWYLSTGEPFDKAGAYALQGAGGVFVEHITGSVSNVVGLPLTLLVQLAERVSLRLPPQSSPNRSPGPHGR
jgi:septum formation protein